MKTNSSSHGQSFRLLLASSLATAALATHAQSSQLVTLQNFGQKFGGVEMDNPVKDLLTATDGSFYGLYGMRGSSVFHLTAAGGLNWVADLSYYSCPQFCTYFYLQPVSLMQAADSNLYTATYINSPGGNVIQLTTGGQWAPIGNAPGSATGGPLVQGPDQKFYGASFNALFSITPTGVMTTNLHTFTALDANKHNQDGYYPLGGLVLGADGNYYGTTSQGGINGFGTLFKVSPTGVFTKLHDFDAATGEVPEASLILANDGNFYGVTSAGGSYGNGAIFKLTPAGAYSVVHSFTSTEGIGPVSRLVESDKGTVQYLYGTTAKGGANNTGTIFSYTTAGKFTIQHTFGATDGSGINSDGSSPNGLTVGDDGDIYGTTFGGGSFAKGTAFELITQKPALTLKLSPSTVSPYQNATLSWTSTSATSCTASGAWSGSEPTAGSQPVMQSVKGTYNYTLTCYGPYGSVSKTKALTVK